MPPRHLMPAFYGGLFIGVLSALPLVSAGNCCCLWIVGGGVIAAWVMQANHPAPISLVDGAIAGVLAGVVGALVYVVASVLVSFTLGPVLGDLSERLIERQSSPEMRELFERFSGTGIGLAVGFVLHLFLGIVFATLGGLVGAAIFRRQAPPSLPT